MGYPIDAKWWNPAKLLLEGKPIDYLGNPNFVHASNIAAIFVCQFFLMVYDPNDDCGGEICI